jgi:hypothetical protein
VDINWKHSENHLGMKNRVSVHLAAMNGRLVIPAVCPFPPVDSFRAIGFCARSRWYIRTETRDEKKCLGLRPIILAPMFPASGERVGYSLYFNPPFQRFSGFNLGSLRKGKKKGAKLRGKLFKIIKRRFRISLIGKFLADLWTKECDALVML